MPLRLLGKSAQPRHNSLQYFCGSHPAISGRSSARLQPRGLQIFGRNRSILKDTSTTVEDSQTFPFATADSATRGCSLNPSGQKKLLCLRRLLFSIVLHMKPFFAGKRKSQIGAPIELLIAVVVMSMSLAIAFYLNDVMACSRCLAEQKGEGQRLADAMHAVSLGFSGTKHSANYVMRSCCGSKVDGVRFARYSSREFCGKCLGSFGSGCWKIEPVGYDQNDQLVPFADASVCVDMSESVEVSESACPELDGKSAVTLDNSPCPRNDVGSLTTECKSYFNSCSNQGSTWWVPQGDACSSGVGTTYFRTFSRNYGASTSTSYQILLEKKPAANQKVALLACAYPRQ